MSKLFNICKKVSIYLLNCNNKRDNGLWVFTEWFGKRCCDNSFYLANYVSTHYAVKVVWIASEEADISRLNDSVVTCRKDSDEATLYLKQASVVVMTHGIAETNSAGYNYCGNALKVNLWHGVMWKKLGYDMNGGASKFQKIVAKAKNNFKRYYLFEAPSEDYRKVLNEAFLIENSEIINAGQPRNSLFYNDSLVSDSRKRMEAILQDFTDVKIDRSTKIITYMPTFRDYSSNLFDFGSVVNLYDFESVLKRNNAVIVQKAHYVSNERNDKEEKEKRRGRVISNNNLDSQLLLAATDLLITDYSSCFFDFLLLDRPIVHFLYDYEYYSKDDRGLYYKYDEVVCGDTAFEEKDLCKMIDDNLSRPYKDSDLRKERREKFQCYESLDSCQMIVNEIFRRLK